MTGRLIAQTDLSAVDRQAMLDLLNAHFDGVTSCQFDADLCNKNWVVLIEQENRIVGFSTLHVAETVVEGELLCVVCSGDTIVAPEAWGTAYFPRAWIGAVYRLRESYPNGRLVWLLLTSGYRTYRFLPVFWQTFYPRWDEPTPIRWKTLLDTLAKDRFGRAYDPATGIVRFDRPQKLRGRLSEIPAGRADDPHVAFFLKANPGHAEGDELVCVADLDPINLSAAGRRVVYGARR